MHVPTAQVSPCDGPRCRYKTKEYGLKTIFARLCRQDTGLFSDKPALRIERKYPSLNLNRWEHIKNIFFKETITNVHVYSKILLLCLKEKKRSPLKNNNGVFSLVNLLLLFIFFNFFLLKMEMFFFPFNCDFYAAFVLLFSFCRQIRRETGVLLPPSGGY